MDSKGDINKMPHYQGKIECIDYIADKVVPGGYEGFCAGNVIKYISRYPRKNGLEDLKKCRYYLDELIEMKEKENKDM